MKKLQHLILLLAFGLLSSGLLAQVQSTLDLAFRQIEDQHTEWGLTKADISDLKISNHVFSKFGEIDHYYFVQRHEGIDVFNAITSVHVNADGKVVSPRHNFIPNLAKKVNSTVAQDDEAKALERVLQNLKIPASNFDFNPKDRSKGMAIFDKGNISRVDIQVMPIYQVVSDSEVRLAWDVLIDPVDNADFWSMRVDAVDGSILDKDNLTIYCNHGSKEKHDNHTSACMNPDHDLSKQQTEFNEESSAAIMGGSYNVFAEMINDRIHVHESPVHGSRNIITDPADPTASPFGWHDVDGEEGAEFTITRGNNVFAYLDLEDTNVPPSSELDVDGGEELVFDFPWTDLENPEASEEAAVTNLFFMNNYMHDFTYAYGFDESAGNFQATNYTGEGDGNDFVVAQAQDGRDLVYNGTDDPNNPHINNANFGTPREGVSPRMQMFIWNSESATTGLLDISEPNGIAANYNTGTADFGPAATENPIIDGELVLAFDSDVQNPTFTCGEVANPEEIAGKIAVIDRGGCLFRDKTLNAQDAGAIAVIICNFEDALLGMTAPVDPNITVTIPTLSLASSDCINLKSTLNAGVTVIANFGLEQEEDQRADFLDGDVDNGIIAHEYGHGISNRLVAGANNTSCLIAEEQMGEGWSDFFAVVTTMKPGDVGDGRNGIGTYVRREDPNGAGIRTRPYSTDLTINPLTYEDLPFAFNTNQITQQPEVAVHQVGTIWNSMLWDMYWDLVDEYGFDDDLISGEGGNNIAVRLVMEGMKFTTCNPGFVDARDGILSADEFLYDGANSCIIWQAFARRGLGVNASQGSNDDYTDGEADFNFPNRCSNAVSVSKRVVGDRFADVVEAGAAVPVEITVRNDKFEPVSETVLREAIAAGTTVGDISNGGEVVGDNIVWELGALEVGQELTFTYTLNVDPNIKSTTLFKDDLENGTESWLTQSDSFEDPNQTENLFTITTADEPLGTNSGNAAFFVQNIDLDSRENLLLIEPLAVEGENPGFRFFQNYDTEANADGTLVQLSLDGEIFEEIPELIFKNSYPRPIQFGTFTIPFLSAYSGSSDGWIDTWVDLSPYKGQTVVIRFRFGTDNNTAGVGWAMDDFEFLDIVNYNSVATVTTAEGDLVETEFVDRGIKIEPEDIDVAVDDTNNPSLEFNIYPNPADDIVNIAINNITADNAQLSVYNYGGQLIEERVLNLSAGNQLEAINVKSYPTGFYFFQLTTDRGVGVEKVMIGK
jgi:Zn-dependent metalloprotease